MSFVCLRSVATNSISNARSLISPFFPMTSAGTVDVFTGGLTRWVAVAPPQARRPEAVDAESKENQKLMVGGVQSRGMSVLSDESRHPMKVGNVTLRGPHVLGPDFPKPVPSTLSLEERFKVCMQVAAECIQPEELRQLLERKAHPICYDGFEPSGRMHIAQGILKAINVNRLTSAGCVFVFWVADWFAMMNNKMGGDISKIRDVGCYFVEVWKAVGMDMRNVRFLWTSEEILKDPQGYWMLVMNIARSNTITRIKRCSQIMGRTEGDDQPASQVFYPCMQCADIFYLRTDICQLGMDQRKVNMLAREYCDEVNIKNKPVIISHAMLPGLLEGQEKMSKSNPDSAIFMEDNEMDVNRKIKKAFCPPGVVEGNPCVAYVESIVFPSLGKFDVERKEQDGGFVSFANEEDFRKAYAEGALHPGDLKSNLAKALNKLIQPVRDHFDNDPTAKALIKKIRAYKTTR